MSTTASTKGKPHQDILTTANYDLFVLDQFNRPIEDALVRKKMALLDKHGWCEGCPMVCVRVEGGKLEVRDGQHRFEAAKRLGIPVWYVVLKNCSITPAEFNANQKGWTLANFVNHYIAKGDENYLELRDFCAQYRMAIGLGACLLAGGCNDSRTSAKKIEEGRFVVTNRKWADRVGLICREIIDVFPYMRTRNAVAAIARFCLVDQFCDQQMIDQCKQYTTLLKPCGTLEQYSQMFEEVYNFQRRINRLPLKFHADAEARKRNAVTPKQEKRRLSQSASGCN